MGTALLGGATQPARPACTERLALSAAEAVEGGVEARADVTRESAYGRCDRHRRMLHQVAALR